MKDMFEQIRTLKAMAADVEDSRIGCGREALVNTELLATLLEAVDDLPTAPPPELTQAFDTYALFQQVQDANETLHADAVFLDFAAGDEAA